MFHVETTAWEGEHAYEAPSMPIAVVEPTNSKRVMKTADQAFATYSNAFGSAK